MTYTFEQLLNVNENAYYVFDICELKNRIQHIRQSLPEKVELCYAVKANTFVTREIIDDVERFEICSPGEAEICRDLEVPTEKMVISGVYKTPSVIEGYVADPSFDGIFTAESMEQYRLISGLSNKYNRKLKVLLRLTNDSQFGMDEDQIEDIISKRSEYQNIEIVGIQFFSGTQKTSLKKYKREIEMLDAFLLKLASEYGFEASELEYGTGFPVSYFDSDKTDEAELFSGFSELIDGMNYKARIILEIGRSMVASCGRYYTHIVDIKRNKGLNYALIDGGMHQLTYYGQYMAMKLPSFYIVGKKDMDIEDEWIVCGSLCSMNDIVVKQAGFPKIELRDTICFENTGAYCMTEGISLFLSRDLPAIYLKTDSDAYLCVRESYETRHFNTPKYN